MNIKLLLTSLLAATVLVSATFAYFSDTKTAQNNTFQAGTLDLSLEETAPQGIDAAGNLTWAPGTEFEGSINLRNDGTIPIDSLTLQAQTEAAE